MNSCPPKVRFENSGPSCAVSSSTTLVERPIACTPSTRAAQSMVSICVHNSHSSRFNPHVGYRARLEASKKACLGTPTQVSRLTMPQWSGPRGRGPAGSKVTDGCEPPCGHWEPNWILCENGWALNPEPPRSLPPHFFVCFTRCFRPLVMAHTYHPRALEAR